VLALAYPVSQLKRLRAAGVTVLTSRRKLLVNLVTRASNVLAGLDRLRFLIIPNSLLVLVVLDHILAAGTEHAHSPETYLKRVRA
jgi:hypothetical protein